MFPPCQEQVAASMKVQVDPATLDAPPKSSLPFVSLGDLTKGIKNKANEFMSRSKEDPEKKKKPAKSNPLADEVARLALEHEEVAYVTQIQKNLRMHAFIFVYAS